MRRHFKPGRIKVVFRDADGRAIWTDDIGYLLGGQLRRLALIHFFNTRTAESEPTSTFKWLQIAFHVLRPETPDSSVTPLIHSCGDGLGFLVLKPFLIPGCLLLVLIRAG